MERMNQREQMKRALSAHEIPNHLGYYLPDGKCLTLAFVIDHIEDAIDLALFTWKHREVNEDGDPETFGDVRLGVAPNLYPKMMVNS